MKIIFKHKPFVVYVRGKHAHSAPLWGDYKLMSLQVIRPQAAADSVQQVCKRLLTKSTSFRTTKMSQFHHQPASVHTL